MTEKGTILLTGATGNVGAVILEHLLEGTSYNVNVVLRNGTKQTPLFQQKFPAETSSGRLTLTSIPDMTAPGAFDTAAASATAIIHCATPITSSREDWLNDMIVPTWAIDHNILSAAQRSPTVRRIIVCGSLLQAVSLKALYDPSVSITATSYDDTSFEEGKAGPWIKAYIYSKTNAERRTWEWYEKNGGEMGTGFDIVMMLPATITGRSPQVGWRPGDGQGGISSIYRALLVSGRAEDVDRTFPIFMDTDDIARAHVLALDTGKVPGNQRYALASHEGVDLRSIIARLKKEYPELAGRLPDVEIDEERFKKRQASLAKVDASKSDAVFGTEKKSAYDSIKEIVLDVVRWEKENHVANT